MTIIVAKKEKGEIVIASDNQASCGGFKFDAKTENTNLSKILKISDDFAIACAGRVSEITIFQRFCERTKPKGDTENDIYDFMVDFKSYCERTMGKFEFDSAYILIFKQKMFEISDGFYVLEKNKYCTLGSGKFEASVAFEMGADAEKAVEMAKKFDIHCGGETQILKVKI